MGLSLGWKVDGCGQQARLGANEGQTGFAQARCPGNHGQYCMTIECLPGVQCNTPGTCVIKGECQAQKYAPQIKAIELDLRIDKEIQCPHCQAMIQIQTRAKESLYSRMDRYFDELRKSGRGTMVNGAVIKAAFPEDRERAIQFSLRDLVRAGRIRVERHGRNGWWGPK